MPAAVRETLNLLWLLQDNRTATSHVVLYAAEQEQICDAFESHVATDESDGSGAGQRLLRASVHAADRHRDSCVKVSWAHTSPLAAQLIPLSGLHNLPQAICG